MGESNILSKISSETNWEKIKKKIEPIRAQQLIIRSLQILSADENLQIVTRIEESKQYSEEVEKLMNLCIRFSSELRRNPHQYDTLDSVCKAILVRQKGKAKVLKKDYRAALGLTYETQLDRIIKAKTPLKWENIERICQGFQDKTVRRFWENQLLHMYPAIAIKGREEGEECLCLHVLCNFLSEPQRERIQENLDEWEQIYFQEITGVLPQAQESHDFGSFPYKLYEVIKIQAARINKTIMAIAEEEVGISGNTWYSWKEKWEEKEKNNFLYGLPRQKLSRGQILILAVLFELNYPETINLLALAGYRHISGEPDCRVAAYIVQGIGSREELKQYLLSNFVTYKW